MDEQFKQRVLAAWGLLPDEVRTPRATEQELLAFEREFGPIPADVRWFFAHCGSGPVGSEWVDSITDLPDTHRHFRADRGGGFWPRMSDVFVLGQDGAGNPYGLHRPTGALIVEDHDFGGVHEVAPSFAEFVRRGLRL